MGIGKQVWLGRRDSQERVAEQRAQNFRACRTNRPTHIKLRLRCAVKGHSEYNIDFQKALVPTSPKRGLKACYFLDLLALLRSGLLFREAFGCAAVPIHLFCSSSSMFAFSYDNYT